MFFLAIKQLLSKPGRTILALLGITFGTAAFLILSGMMLGFREYFIQRLINTTAHITIKAEEPVIEEHSLDPYFFPDKLVKWVVPPVSHDEPPHLEYPQGWFDRLDADENVLAYAPQITAQVLVNRGKLTRTITLIGVEAAKQVRATDVQDDMTVGNFLDLDKGGFQIIIGESLAQKLGLHVNDTLNIVDIKGAVVPAKVVGFFNTGMTQIDDVTAYAPIHYVQQANQTPGQVSQIIVKLKDITLAKAVADQWASMSRENVQSWDEANANFFQVFKMQDMIRYILSFVVLMIAAFGIYNILNMMVMQKRGEIAILRSMGFEAMDIIQLFLSQGLILGFIGGLLGLGLGTLVCLYVQTITFSTGVSITRINHMLIAWHAYFYVSGFLLAFLSGLFAGFLPARAASRMAPIDILRTEGARMGFTAQNIVKSFGQPPTVVLKSLSFEIADGEFVAITGRSGSGKSTLLYSLSTLDPLTSGTLLLDGQDTRSLSTKAIHRFRNQNMGFVFQFHYLLPELDCEENVLFPARKVDRHEELRKYAVQLMEQFEIGHIRKKLSGQISGGERQRVAIARAMIMRPKYLLADEPTGNLDSMSGEKVIGIFERINREQKTTILMVTHEQDYADRAGRQIGLRDGTIEFDRKKK